MPGSDGTRSAQTLNPYPRPSPRRDSYITPTEVLTARGMDGEPNELTYVDMDSFPLEFTISSL